MDNKDKIIEEMAKDIETIETEEGHKMLNETFAYLKEHHKYNSKEDYAKAHDKTIYQRTAEVLYNAGHRKVATDDEFFKELRKLEFSIKQEKEQAVKEFYTKVRNQIMLHARIQTVDTADDTPDLLSDEVLECLDETLKEVIGEKE